MNKLTCFYCGHDLCWENDFDAQDIYSEYEEDEGAIVSMYHCTHCGRMYEVVDPTKNEKEVNYSKYWGDNVND